MNLHPIFVFICLTFYITECYDKIYISKKEKFRIKRDISSTNNTNLSDTLTKAPNYVKEVYNYYVVETYNDPQNNTVQYYFKEFNDVFSSNLPVNNDILSNNYDTYLSINLTFPLLYYGTTLSKITIAVAGFIYMNDIAATKFFYKQYVAPLMGDFSTLNEPDSTIVYCDTGKAFFVKWSNVFLYSQQDNGNFTFQVGLYENGTIVLIYNEISTPASTPELFNKVGIADSYVISNVRPPGRGQGRNQRRPPVAPLLPGSYLYDEIAINRSNIISGTVIILTPNPTCAEQLSCSDCLTVTNFKCSWCPKANRCSNGNDRYKQAWQDNACPLQNVTQQEFCPISQNIMMSSSSEFEDASTVFLIVIVSACLLVIVVATIAWIVYAYSHPNSSSGIWLIEHRPSELFRKLCKKQIRNNDEFSESNTFHSLA